MKVATLSWNYETSSAKIDLDGTAGESITDGMELIARAFEDRPWREIDGEETPVTTLSFFAQAFAMIGYEVRFGGGIEGQPPLQRIAGAVAQESRGDDAP